MTELQIKAAFRLNTQLTRQSKEKRRSFKQHAATKED